MTWKIIRMDIMDIINNRMKKEVVEELRKRKNLGYSIKRSKLINIRHINIQTQENAIGEFLRVKYF